MTYEEAKMQIQAIPEKIWDQLSEPDREAMEMTFSALEKQIPQEPIEKPEKHNKDICKDLRLLYCPSCENWIGMWHNRIKCGDMYNNYNSHICPYCGQAIDCEE